MGIIDLDTQNKCLLSKCIVKLLNEDGMWQQVLKKKYLNGKSLSQVARKKGDSHFWAGLMAAGWWWWRAAGGGGLVAAVMSTVVQQQRAMAARSVGFAFFYSFSEGPIRRTREGGVNGSR
jgi:hypothetical protein